MLTTMLFARRNTILFLVLLMLFSCNPNESINSYDYRDDVIGTYEGFKVDTRWKDTLVGWTHDTTLTQVIVAKAAEDSMVTDTVDIEDHMVLAVAVHRPFQFSDHAAPICARRPDAVPR
jgi:hypothetical protein